MPLPVFQSTTSVFQTTLPVVWSSATIWPSSWPMKTMPSPSATPRLSQPQQTVSIFWSRFALYCQRILPVLTSTANTSSAPVAW